MYIYAHNKVDKPKVIICEITTQIKRYFNTQEPKSCPLIPSLDLTNVLTSMVHSFILPFLKVALYYVSAFVKHCSNLI